MNKSTRWAPNPRPNEGDTHPLLRLEVTSASLPALNHCLVLSQPVQSGTQGELTGHGHRSPCSPRRSIPRIDDQQDGLYTRLDEYVDLDGTEQEDRASVANLLAKINEVLSGAGDERLRDAGDDGTAEHELQLLKKVDEILRSHDLNPQSTTDLEGAKTDEAHVPQGYPKAAARDNGAAAEPPAFKALKSSSVRGSLLHNCGPYSASVRRQRTDASNLLPTNANPPVPPIDYYLPKINYVSFLGDSDTFMENAIEPIMRKYAPQILSKPSPRVPRAYPSHVHRQLPGEQTTIADQFSMTSLEAGAEVEFYMR